MPGRLIADVRVEEEGEGVTSEAAEPAISTPGQMGVPLLTEKLTKMITGVQNGPVASGDGRAVVQLNIQDCRDIRDAAAKLKISKNAAVQAACGNLDDQEGRGWLGADTLGVTLVLTIERRLVLGEVRRFRLRGRVDVSHV
jgi:hypothetical protein